MKQKVLVVDDEPDAIELIAFNLRKAGYEIFTADNGKDALQKARVFLPDIIVLDVMMPALDGFEVCRMLRRDPITEAIPIIMVTAKSTELDRILGLELGADDFVTKPFSPRELMLRVKNLLQRRTPPPLNEELYQFHELQIDIPRYEVTVGRRPIDLTVTEFKLLTTLIDRRGRVQSRERLLLDVWGYESAADSRTVDTHMRRLREKLGKAARFLDTVRGIGYRFNDSAT